jgi:hypothetical protein
MYTNATVTITRPGTDYDDDTGCRTEGSSSAVASNVPCLFSQNRGSRVVNSNGVRESVRALYGTLIPDPGEWDVRIGDQAVVVHEGQTRTFTVSDAVKTGGIAEVHWEVTLEDIKTP